MVRKMIFWRNLFQLLVRILPIWKQISPFREIRRPKQRLSCTKCWTGAIPGMDWMSEMGGFTQRSNDSVKKANFFYYLSCFLLIFSRMTRNIRLFHFSMRCLTHFEVLSSCATSRLLFLQWVCASSGGDRISSLLPQWAVATMTPCDVAALKKCLEQHKGDGEKCKEHIAAFKTACSSASSSSQQAQSSLPLQASH